MTARAAAILLLGMEHAVRDPDFVERIRSRFALQTIMQTFGAGLEVVEPGRVEIAVAFGSHLTQQHGYFHAGVTTTLLDSACGFAAMTLTPPGGDCLTVEFKANFLRPAEGQRLTARGRVLSAGRTLTVCQSEATATRDGKHQVVAIMLATIRTFEPRG